MNHIFKVAGILILFSVAFTLLSALITVPVERTRIDPTAQVHDSDYVIVHGLPLYFHIVGGYSGPNSPSRLHLCRNFLCDIGLFFGGFVALWVAAELIGLLGRSLAWIASSVITSLRLRRRKTD